MTYVATEFMLLYRGLQSKGEGKTKMLYSADNIPRMRCSLRTFINNLLLGLYMACDIIKPSHRNETQEVCLFISQCGLFSPIYLWCFFTPVAHCVFRLNGLRAHFIVPYNPCNVSLASYIIAGR